MTYGFKKLHPNWRDIAANFKAAWQKSAFSRSPGLITGERSSICGKNQRLEKPPMT